MMVATLDDDDVDTDKEDIKIKRQWIDGVDCLMMPTDLLNCSMLCSVQNLSWGTSYPAHATALAMNTQPLCYTTWHRHNFAIHYLLILSCLHPSSIRGLPAPRQLFPICFCLSSFPITNQSSTFCYHFFRFSLSS